MAEEEAKYRLNLGFWIWSSMILPLSCCPSSWAHGALAWLVPVAALYSNIILQQSIQGHWELGYTQSRGPLGDGWVYLFKGIEIQLNVKAIWFFLLSKQSPREAEQRQEKS